MEEAVKKLKDIVQKYPAVLGDEKKLKSILKDYFPDDKRIQNQLLMVSEEGILDDMQGTTEIKKFKMLGYIHGLAADYGIAESMAKGAIMLWAVALNINAENVSVEDSQSSRGPNRQGNIIDYSNMSTDDLDLTGTVIRFSGTGEKIIPNVRLQAGTYVVKASTSVIVTYYDCKRQRSVVLNGEAEKIWQPYSSIDFSEVGIVEVKNTSKSWVVEFLPV